MIESLVSWIKQDWQLIVGFICVVIILAVVLDEFLIHK